LRLQRQLAGTWLVAGQDPECFETWIAAGGPAGNTRSTFEGTVTRRPAPSVTNRPAAMAGAPATAQVAPISNDRRDTPIDGLGLGMDFLRVAKLPKHRTTSRLANRAYACMVGAYYAAQRTFVLS
jgi:hypothetical protein